MQFVATVAKGLESLMAGELREFEALNIKEGPGFVRFEAPLSVAYRACLWSRFASRILLQLAQGQCRDGDELYELVQTVYWPQHFDVNKKFAVRFSGQNDEIRNTQFGALRVKDAIADQFQKRLGERPYVDKVLSDVVIHAQLYRDQVTLFLDLCGEPLHQRGYRQKTGAAPLKENLAAAIVARSGWDKSSPLIDPMCGSGTLLIEAALMATDTAPALHREWFALTKLNNFDEQAWLALEEEAFERHRIGKKQFKHQLLGRDLDPMVIKNARSNVQAAGLAAIVHFEEGDALQLQNPYKNQSEAGKEAQESQLGWIISNPPYGERIGEITHLSILFHRLGYLLKQEFPAWHLSLFTSNPELLSLIRMRSSKKYKLFNGPLECELKHFVIGGNGANQQLPAQDFANRLSKNIKGLKKWAKREDLTCYRLYDADLPEYNVAIDKYDEYLVIQEYAPPKNMDPNKATQRFYDLVAATAMVCDMSGDKIILKQRKRQSGKEQYQKNRAENKDDVRFVVQEYGAQYWLNLSDYLDNGLFLDHRNMRKIIREQAKGKRFLNLFAYTGTATVQAALAGAQGSVSVDLSRTYLDWAKKNLSLNKVQGPWHQFVQEDPLSWLARARDKFELIFVNPPTFSNSKAMQGNFDVQRDHVKLLEQVSKVLDKQGLCYFSNNKRNFKMDLQALDALGLKAENINKQSLPKDFERNANIHNTWKISHI